MMLITYDKEHMNQKLIKSRIHSSNFITQYQSNMKNKIMQIIYEKKFNLNI